MYDRNRTADGGQSDGAVEDADDDDAQLAALTDDERATLLSCVDQIRDVLGDALAESHMRQIVLSNDFDADRSLDDALQASQRAQEKASAAKAQRSKATPPRQAATKTDKGERSHVGATLWYHFLGVNDVFSFLCFVAYSTQPTLVTAPPHPTHTHALEQGKMRVH